MLRKLLIVLMIAMLSIAGGSAIVYASDSIGQLDNRGETESIAGITWDEIQEQSQNSPNSLSPIEGLVVWMFAILAFLKLAQKMDSLLQSLGLNVTQTGGRAVGDLIMAGMALKHVGNAVSKGMGMFGFGGGKGGGSGSSASGTSGSGTGAGSAGSAGSAPIPTDGHRGRPMPTGASPGGASPGRHTTPGGASSTGGTPMSTSGATPGSSPGGGATPSTTPPSNPSSTSGASGSTGTTATSGSRNPIGKAVDWMKGDGFAQGAIKAGAKGGLIGVGAYTAKAGASKIGSAVSARLGGNSIPTDPHATNDNVGTAPDSQPIDTNNDSASGAYTSENPEAYQASIPFDGTEDAASIPTSFNDEEYQEAKPTDATDESSVAYSSINDKEYHNSDSHDNSTNAPPIPTSTNDEDWQDSEGHPSDSESSAASPYTNNDDEQWHDTKPADISAESVQIPTAINNEGWQDSDLSGSQPAQAIDSASGVSPTPPTKATSIAPAEVKTNGEQWHDTTPNDTPKGSAPIPTAINNEEWQSSNPSDIHPKPIVDSASRVTPAPQSNVVPAAPSQQGGEDNTTATPKVPALESTSIQQVADASVQSNSTPSLEGADAGSMTQQSTLANVTSSTEMSATTSESILSETSVASSENISAETSVISAGSVSGVHESSSGYESSFDGHGASQDVSSGANVEIGSDEAAPMPLHNPAISGDFPRNGAPLGLSQDASDSGTIGASGTVPDLTPHAPIQSSSAAISASFTATTAPMHDSANIVQPQAVSEIIRAELPAPTQAHGATMVALDEPASLTQAHTTVPPQATNINHSKTDVSTPAHPMEQVTTQTVHMENHGHSEQPATAKADTSARPTTKGKPRNPSEKGRKRKR